MQINRTTLTWLVLGFIWCIVMGITVVSIGFGSIFPALNEIAGPFVCPNGQMELLTQNYQVSPVENGSVLTWYCVDRAGARTELNPFTTINLYAGSIYGLSIFAIIALLWYGSYRRNLTPHEETPQEKKRNQLITAILVIAFVLAVTIFNLRPLLFPDSPLVNTAGVIQITVPPPTAFATPTPQGLLLWFGGHGTGPGFFNGIRGLAVDPATGAIFAGDLASGRVEAFDPTGKFVTEWQVNASPIILGADQKGNVFVASTGDQIHRYDSNGRLIATLSVPGGTIQHMVVGADGNLVIATIKVGETVQNMIFRMTPDGRILDTIQNAFTDNGGRIEHEMRVAVDTSGDIYALGSRDNQAVFKFSPAGKFIKSFVAGDAPGQPGAPQNIAVDSQDRVYLSDPQGIQAFDSEGNPLSLVKANVFAYDIVFDGQDNMYVTTNNDQVLKFSPPNP